VKELDNRFKVVEVAKTYQARFSKRSQKSGETVEEYAADLKRLYDKAFVNRPHRIRQEDLLRRFLDGLFDNKARQQVEFVKEPKGIDEAVVEVVTFLESQKKISENDDFSRTKKRTGMVRPAETDSDSEDSDEEPDEGSQLVNRIPESTGKAKGKANDRSFDRNSKQSTTGQKSGQPASSEMKQILELLTAMKTEQDVLKADQQLLTEKLEVLSSTKDAQTKVTKSYKGKGQSTGNRVGQSGKPLDSGRSSCCYRCGQEGHFAKACPYAPWIAGQMQMAYQPVPISGTCAGVQPVPVNMMNRGTGQPGSVVGATTSSSAVLKPACANNVGSLQMVAQPGLN